MQSRSRALIPFSALGDGRSGGPGLGWVVERASRTKTHSSNGAVAISRLGRSCTLLC